MIIRKTVLSVSIAAILDLAASAAMAQAAPAPAPAGSEELENIIVYGIRASSELAIELKRDAPLHIDVISAEEIGKMPYKNIADTLQHVPGITISAASANEGAFDENDRVSMRGTSPSLTQTLINGHYVASGDWFVLNQTGTVGRSVSYSLLPSEIVDHVVAYKTSMAKLVEGGAVGSIDIVTRRPLNFEEGFTALASVGGVWAELPDKTDPQLSGMISWKNEADNLGFYLEAFDEERHLRRDGQEILGYGQVSAASATGQAHPDLIGVYFPNLMGSALFEQERQRYGGMAAAEFKPTDDVTLLLTGFTSTMKADNYNRNYMFWGDRIINGTNGTNGAVPDPGYVVKKNTLVNATFTADPTKQYGIYDQIARPGEESDTYYVTLDGAWTVNDKLSLSGQGGFSEGHGKTPTQNVAEWDIGLGTGAAYAMHGIGAANWNLGTADTSQPGIPLVDVKLDWIFGLQDIDVKDQEDWLKFDGEYLFDGAITSADFGVRFSHHTRDLNKVVAQGPACIDVNGNVDPSCPPGSASPFDPANWPQGYKNYPNDFADFSGSFPRDIWYYTESQLKQFDRFTNRDPITRFYYPGAYGVDEDASAAYAQMNFKNGSWSGNIGLRFVQTDENITTYVNASASDPKAITTSLFGPYVKVHTDNTYNDLLPSANLTFNMTDDALLRVGISQTMARPDYSALAGSVSLLPPAAVGGTGSGTGGNPDLRPIISTNVDLSFEWYFETGAMATASVYFMDLDDYVQFGHRTASYFTIDNNNPQGAFVDYDLTVPVNSHANVKGFELSWQQPFGKYFGASANYTYSSGNASDSDGNGKDDDVLGLSKTVYNVGGYFENDRFSARLNWSWRSWFYSGLDRSTAFYQDDAGYLAGTLGWKITDNFALSLDGMNLNNPKIKYYALNDQQPRSIYENGSQYYLTLRMQF